MGGKDLGFDVVLHGQARNHIMPCTYVFFQRLKEHGGGFWLSHAYDDWFGFVIKEPVSLRQGIEYLMSIQRTDPRQKITESRCTMCQIASLFAVILCFNSD